VTTGTRIRTAITRLSREELQYEEGSKNEQATTRVA